MELRHGLSAVCVCLSLSLFRGCDEQQSKGGRVGLPSLSVFEERDQFWAVKMHLSLLSIPRYPHLASYVLNCFALFVTAPCFLVWVLQEVEGVQQWAFKAAASALEVIPRTLAQNCGANVVRVLTQLRVRGW